MKTETEICCPLFEPAPWDNQTLSWNKKPFIRVFVPQIFHIPLPGKFDKAVKSLWETAKMSNIAPPEIDFLLLSRDPSAWKSELLLSVTKLIAGADIVELTGSFLTKVFDGPFSDIPKFIGEMDSFLAERGKKAKDYYFNYRYCPKCARKYGHNYIVLFAEV